ncbi:hypothetical protein ACUN7V_00155 [Quadrisphaera oryzae]|uniref:hypothetical protein n=1 Tax=Quadrisphaera TaxID=317661 RepID=UPI0016451B23|nr:hypothetical protein [Quadrisphaera sp. RL12-1S]MBC3762988.1 hypothetical protein [Quadrisphaera sp. RL12-1S]
MRLVLLGGAPGVGKSAVARAVLARHAGPVGSAPLLQWVDVDALWMHQPWRVDGAMRALVASNLGAVLTGAAGAGVEVALVTWTFHTEELRDVVRGACPASSSTTVQLVAQEAAWRQRFSADPARGAPDAFYEQRYAAAQAAARDADVVVDTTGRTIDACADDVGRVTLSR